MEGQRGYQRCCLQPRGSREQGASALHPDSLIGRRAVLVVTAPVPIPALIDIGVRTALPAGQTHLIFLPNPNPSPSPSPVGAGVPPVASGSVSEPLASRPRARVLFHDRARRSLLQHWYPHFISRRCLSARSLLLVSSSSCLNRAQPMLLGDATLKLRMSLG